jgi:ABC-type glutathione transport system ATPase component
MLEACHLRKHYVQGRWYSRRQFHVTALDDVNLTIEPGSTLALVGESGAGKSTLGRCLSRLEEPDSGEIRFDGRNLWTLRPEELLAARRNIQLIFQDSAMAMNHRFSAAEIVEEPLLIQKSMSRTKRRKQALTLMEQVGISSQWAQRSALEFSGGERQRLAIARALTLKPRVLILDEALASLDFETQEQIAKLLLDLQASFSLAYLFITHDFRLAARMANRIAVMWKGRIVESGSVPAIFSEARHPSTRLLLAAAPDAQDDALARIPREH